MKSGDVFEYNGRYFRLRHPDEWVEPTDYHVGHATLAADFRPFLPVHMDSGSRDKSVWRHVHEISALSYAMRTSLAAKQPEDKAG